MTKQIVLGALQMAVWRREPTNKIIVHSDQGSQYKSYEWQLFLVDSMSQRGKCHDNAAAESFFHLLKRERIKKRAYTTREQAIADIFNYIEIFYNVKRKHGSNNLLSPVNFENQYRQQLESV